MGMLEKIAIYSELWQKEVLEKKEAKKRLKRDEQGRPIIKLTVLEKIAVHSPTQQEHNTLMQVYECGGWKWIGMDLPTSKNFWDWNKEKTCTVVVGFNDFYSRSGRPTKKFGNFAYNNRDSCQLDGYKVLSTQKFYKEQKITKSMINEIKDYFEDKK